MALATAPAWAGDAAPMDAAPAAAATDPADFSADIDRLMELFQVRRISGLSVDHFVAQVRVGTVEQRACLSSTLKGGAIYDQMRTVYESLYTDPVLRADTMRFVGSPAGSKVVARTVKEIETGTTTRMEADLTPEELKVVNAFLESPTGARFLDMSGQMQSMQNQFMQRIIPDAARQCGLLSKS